MKKVKRTKEEWSQLIEGCKARDKQTSIAHWCCQQGININTYKYWKKKLQDQESEETTTFVPLSLPIQQLTQTAQHQEIQIRCKDCDIFVTQQTPPALLTSILTAVRAASC